MINKIRSSSASPLSCIIHKFKKDFHNSYSNELGSPQDLSLQCYFWALHARLVGALSLQYTGCCGLFSTTVRGTLLISAKCKLLQ
ncbi:hypothetical protein ACS0TY_020085 [Phlomoides rotata]